MARTLVTAAVQLAAHSRKSFAQAWPRIEARLEEAARAGAQLVVLPEATMPGYVLGYEPFRPEEIRDALERCAAFARVRGVVLVVGAAREESGRVFNSAVVIDRTGEIAGSADKHFLWHFDRQWFAAGERIKPVATSIGKIGALVCADGRIPTIARTLVDCGAEILVMPTAWVTSGRDPQQFENVQADLLARVRARENGVPFVAANKSGTELGCVAYCGKSQIAAADGGIVAVASQDGEEMLLSQIEVGSPKPYRSRRNGAVADAQPMRACRIAVAAREPQSGDDSLLRIIEADVLIHPEDRAGSYAVVDDDVVLDPGGLAAMRMRGHTFAVWRTAYDPAWQTSFARARALELRMYLAVIDAQHKRAYAVDPDGTVVCGTFPGYDIASFPFDPARTAQTAVAPGTDVLEGLNRAHMHALD